MSAPDPIDDATALVLAGGSSRRMGRDKCLLPHGGVPLIQHVTERIAPLFSEVVVSAADVAAYPFLGRRVVADRVPGEGPLMGLASAMPVIDTPWCFAIATDMPDPPVELIRRMAGKRAGCPVVIPQEEGGRLQPLFAFYHRDVLASLDAYLAEGKRSMRGFLTRCSTRCVSVPSGQITNINTPSDCEAGLREGRNGA